MMQFKSECPPDYQTLWGFFDSEEPHVLRLMLDPVASLLQEQDRVRRVSERMGADYLTVNAPPCVRDIGVPEVFAFPIGVLREAFPANP